MKKLIFLILTLSLTSIYGDAPKKTICLNMIVKDESEVIERCLASVKPIIDTWVIVDTGSSDGTQKIIKKFMKGIPGELHQRPWVNFEHNRNEALKLAKGKSDYVLIIDADDMLVYNEDFLMPELDKDQYAITIEFGGTRYERPQLINNALPWEWKGVLHEYLYCPEVKTRSCLENVTYFERREGNRSQDPNKYIKDSLVLEEALKKEPSNSRYMFYLAQSYRDAQMKEKALESYKKRTEMGGWDEELFYAKYQVGLMLKDLEKPYEEIVNAFTEAFDFRKSRAEPLYHLANYFRLHNNFFLGYLVASKGLELPYPSDTLFVEKWVYEWGLQLEKSVCAYWIGKYEECLKISTEMLQNISLPKHVRECVQGNVQWALAKIAEQSVTKQPTNQK